MKISRHFRAFLEMHGYLELPAIGRFEITNNNSPDPAKHGRRLEFSYISGTAIDISLVKFLCEKLRTEACVINSDLQYFSASIMELLMQGLEAEVPGIGYLNKKAQNQLQFSFLSRYYKIPDKKPRKPLPVYLDPSFWM
jgi:hypothetical protein